MTKRALIIDAFVYAIKTTINNIGTYVLSLLATLGIIIISTILIAGSYILIFANQSPAFQEYLRLCFSGKSFTFVNGQAIATPESIALTQKMASTFSPFMIALGVFFIILFLLVILAIFAGFIRMQLVLHDTGKTSLNDFITGFSYTPRLFIVYSAIAIITGTLGIAIALPAFLLKAAPWLQITMAALGSMLIIGMIARFYLSPYFIIDDQTTIIGSLKASWLATQDKWLLITALLLFSWLLMSRSTLCLAILFPLTLMAVYIYRSIIPATQAGEE